MAKLIDNASGNVSQGVIIERVEDSYRLSFNCSSMGIGKSFIRIYATLSDTSYKTYFFPIQFLNKNVIEFSLDNSTSFIQFDMIGDAIVTGITLEEVTNATMEYVKANASYWDRIKKVTNDIGKVRTDMLQGLIDMTVNAFANESKTITQENGIMTFLNGASPESSTEAVQICGGVIRIANAKDGSGNWEWKTAITGAGIHADTIIARTLSTVDFSSANIESCNVTSAHLVGCDIKGGNLLIGVNPDNLQNFRGCAIDSSGTVYGYLNGEVTYMLTHSPEGRLSLVCPTTGKSMSLNSNGYSDGSATISASKLRMGDNGYTEIIVDGGNNDIKLNTYGSSGTISLSAAGGVTIFGDLDVTGSISHR